MLLVEITNSTEMVASKTHKLFGKTPFETIDKSIVEAQVIKQMSEDLATWGLEGSISIVKGIEVQEDTIVMRKGFAVKQRKEFGKGVKKTETEYSKPR
ncbi:hypothetical protein [Prochlorococcus sp. MIT 1307]|uniref:hypothetical protein n=1 Tax=Prochlorococcus sp. MIT 1307 TaxID=3096219 RepID=UPI002A761561|nr:hypothetical protein [Prochlorococcus sp. MIT 1307]